MPLPQVYGLFSLAEEPAVRAIEVKSGMLLVFTLVAQDRLESNQPIHKYNTSLFVKNEELDKWKQRLESGKVFLVSGGEWRVTQKDDYKFGISQLSLNTFNFKALKTPWWVEDKPE